MWMYLLLVAAAGMLMILSSGIELNETISWYRKPFRKSAVYLTEKMIARNSGRDAQKEAEKLEMMMLCFCLGLAIFPVLDGAVDKGEKILESYSIERPEKGQGTSSYALQAEIQNEESAEEIRVELKERQYSEKEKEELLKKAVAEAEKILIGNNSSPDEVRGAVVLPAELQEGEVTAQWIQSPEGLLDENGIITEDLTEKGAVLNLTAMLTCEDKEELYETSLHLYPAIRTKQEQLRTDLQKAVNTAQEESLEKKTLQLPRQINGRNITWLEKKESLTGLWLMLIFVVAAAGYAGKSEEFKKEEKLRTRQMILDYPDVVFKMGMLLNAGLTIQNAFTRIAEEYQETKQKKGVRWAYEEMVIACNEMKSGIPEARAYERFGRRCEQTCYIRLGTILSGSLQKSSEGMTNLLLQEAEEAMEERRQLAKKMGEEAGTRLLFPMLLMLMVVLVILIVPALLSF